jgi:hypothetical protein
MRIRAICWMLACLAVVFPSFAAAQATRTWVSGVGDDVNPCSRTAPCKTFAGAISKTAPGGTIDVLDPGGFGAVTITKSITIDGGHAIAGVLASGTNGIVVNAGPTDAVILRNLFIDGAGSPGPAPTGLVGVSFLAGGSLYVEHSVIQNFTNWGINFTPSGAGQLFVTDVTVRKTMGGIFVGTAGVTTLATIVDSLIEENGRAAVRADVGAIVTVRRTVATHGANGFVACNGVAGATPVLTLEDSLATYNSGRGVTGSDTGCLSGTIYLNHNGIYGNAVGVNVGPGGSVQSWGNNTIVFNTTNGSPSGTIALH